MASLLLLIGSCSAATVIGFIGYVYYKYRICNKLPAPSDVVVLYQVGRGPRAPSVSPFPMKLETFLRMHRIPYINDHSARMSSKSKTPWIEYNGEAVADSQMCIEYLKEQRNIEVDSHLTDEQKAIARAFLKLTEENLYWTMCLEVFGKHVTTVKTVILYTGIKLWLMVTFLRKVIAKETWGHGIGRHTREEVWQIAVKDMTAISHFLGTKTYLMGDTPSEVDCAVFGMMAQIYWHMPDSRHQVYIKEHLPNLVDYIHRVRDRFWPDWDTVTLEGQAYTSDHRMLYFSDTVPDCIDCTKIDKPCLK